MYDTVTIDTVGICWELCEKFICTQSNVNKISEVPWGQGYTACKREFEDALRQITLMGYGLIIIAHNEEKIIKNDKGEDITVIGPALPKRGAAIINQLVDIIGYIGVQYDEEGNSSRFLYTRSTPTVQAGSRFKYLPPRIPFGYEELTEALANAIEEEAKHGAIIVEKSKRIEDVPRPFPEVRAEAEKLWKELVEKDSDNAARILAIVEKIFDRPMKLSEITPNQQDLFELVISEMREL